MFSVRSWHLKCTPPATRAPAPVRDAPCSPVGFPWVHCSAHAQHTLNTRSTHAQQGDRSHGKGDEGGWGVAECVRNAACAKALTCLWCAPAACRSISPCHLPPPPPSLPPSVLTSLPPSLPPSFPPSLLPRHVCTLCAAKHSTADKPTIEPYQIDPGLQKKLNDLKQRRRAKAAKKQAKERRRVGRVSVLRRGCDAVCPHPCPCGGCSLAHRRPLLA